MKPEQCVLVVEDDRSWQQILHELFRDADFEVDLADNLEVALALISQRTHRIAVVDLSLVSSDHLNHDGLTVLKEIRQRDPTCITILLTGFATVEIAVNALTSLGVFTCLRKEMFQRNEFRQLVKNILETSIPLTGQPTTDMTDIQSVRSTLGSAAEYDKPPAIVVDDDAGWRELISELLTDAGFKVRACHSFGEAVGRLRRELYKLAVVDLSLEKTAALHAPDRQSDQHDWDGVRLLTSVRSKGIPIVVVSGVANADEIERVYQEQGIFSFIEKRTFDRKVFLQTIHEAVKAQQSQSPIQALTSRELEVLEMISQGATNKEIAEALFITPNTVKRHLKSIFGKMDIHTRSAAAAKAINWLG